MRTLARLISIPLFALLISVPAVFAQEDEQGFTQAEVDQMLAPIALYPDTLLSHILMAATYPLEVVAAARWSRDNPGLEGERAVEAVADEDWDPSVKALVEFPRVLERMHEDLDWTTRLGDAFLYQEAQVMATVQGLRQRAYEAGNLDSTGNVRVIRERDVIVIEPVHPRIVYVPYYNPRVIYGAWWWPAYPPVYWAPPPGFFLGSGFFFGSGVHVSLGFFFSTFDWHRHHVVVVHRHHHLRHVPHFKLRTHVKRHGHKWRHESKHRRGIAYRHDSLQRKHGRSRASGIAHSRHSDGGNLHRSRGTHSGRDGINRGSRRTFAAGRTDDRRTAGHIRSRDFTRSHTDRARSATSSGKRSGIRPGTSRSGRRSIGTRSFGNNDVARGSRGAERRTGKIRRPDSGIGANRGISRSQIQSRRSDARRAMSQRRQAAQSRRGATTRGFSRGRIESRVGDANRAMGHGQRAERSRSAGQSRSARTQRRRSAGDSRAGRQFSRGATLSRGLSISNRGGSRGITGQRSGASRGLGRDRMRSFNRGRSSSRVPGTSAGRSAFSRP